VSAKGRNRHILALDWDSRSLRVVHALVGKRAVTIDRMLAVAIPSSVDPANPQQMGHHIRRVLDQEEIATRQAIVDIPRDQAILNTLSLPATVPGELPGMVAIQIAKELPFAVGEAVIDFAVPKLAAGESTAEVLVAAVRREVVDQYAATAAAAGLRLERIGLRPYAHCVAACELLKHAMPERVMFIDVRPTLTEIDVLRHSFLAFSRAASVVVPESLEEGPRLSLVEGEAGMAEAPLGRGQFSEPASRGGAGVIRALMVEVTRSIEAYRVGDRVASIDHAVIGGDLGVEELLAEEIQKRLGITTELYNPASSFGWEPDEGASASAFAATLGLVLSQHQDTGQHFDFLHPKRSESTAKKRLRKAPAVAAVFVLFAAAGIVAVTESTADERKALTRIEQRIVQLEGQVRENLQFRKLVEEITVFDEVQHVWVDVMRDVISALPSNQELVLDHLDLKQSDGKGDSGRVELKTRAKRAETATNAIRALEEFRREGADKPRFKASMRTQSEKAGEKYPFAQELWVQILDDGLKATG